MIILVLKLQRLFSPQYSQQDETLSVSHLASLVEPEPFKGKWVLQLPVSLLGVQGNHLKTKKLYCFEDQI